MRIDKSQAMVVLVGAFNTQILRDPRWIKQYLFPDSSQDAIELKMNLEMPAEKITSVVEIDGIKVEVSSGRLAITPKDVFQEDIDSIYGVIKNISKNLPHTPMVAYGINFGFIEKCTKPFLWKKSNFANFLMSEDSTKETLELKQMLQYDGYMVNYSISEKKISVREFEEQLRFNFHTPLNTNAKQALNDLLNNKKIENYMNIAQEHIKHVFSVVVEA